MTVVVPATTVCSNPECHVGETGKCIEGLSVDKCPRYGRPISTAPQAAATAAPRDDIQAKSEGLLLAPGGLLPFSSAHDILRQRDARIISVLGARAAGKTSLIASLYGLFQDSSVAQFAFAGCETLVAFEEACHDARASSQRPEPHFERTKRGVTGLYHLALSVQQGEPATNLLLADRAGEEYLEVADDPSGATSLAEVRCADTLTLLVDGSRLLDMTARHNLRSELEMMMQAFLDGGVLRGDQNLAVILTKADELARSADRVRAEGDFSRLAESVSKLFGSVFARIERFQIAASPTSDVLPRGYGVSDVLTFWMSARPIGQVVAASTPAPARAFGRLVPANL